MNVQPHRFLWTLVARGGALPPGEHVERISQEADVFVRLAALNREAQAAGEPLVSRILPPSQGASR